MLIDADKLKAEINGIIKAITTNGHPDVLGTEAECMVAAETEALNLVLETINTLKRNYRLMESWTRQQWLMPMILLEDCPQHYALSIDSHPKELIEWWENVSGEELKELGLK